ncbi:hypothetical protein MKW94_017908 [Papaver nudicaule]|uniref:Starch synthase, chloroplastic/amyloplastic n=1 Tax=Papaver nudicaule TaxID=74823 RepID=A0AA41VV12_PAPNU|nr:hypothetical protein [Papaver nudicaule]
MASSIGSPSFIVGATREKKNSVLVSHTRRPKFHCSTGRSFLGCGSKCGLLKVENGDKILRAIGKSGGDDSNVDEAEDRIQATINKSKKVLALQKELLQQIAERKELVSSIRNSITQSEEELIFFNETNKSIQDPDISGGDTDGQSTSGIASSRYTPSAGINIPAGVEGEKVPERKVPTEQVPPNKNAQEISKANGSLETFRSERVPLFQPEVSESYSVIEEMVGEVAKVSHGDSNSEAHGTPEEENIGSPPLAGVNVMNIILVAAECTPWSKTGGLGDVAGALPKALARRGHRVMVVAPYYGKYAEPEHTGVHRRYTVDGQDMEVNYFQAYIDGVDFVFIDSPVFRNIENNIYGGKREDILKRMVLFCKAAVEVPWYVPCGGVCYGDGNLVFIANDWHTALLPVYLKAYYRDNGLMSFARSVLVIHNIAHQGRGPVDDFKYVDLPGHYLDQFKLYDPLGGDHFNIFAAGLKTADRILTVSHGYAWELKTQEGGWGLDGIINDNHWKLTGIVNGIDTTEWSPQVDVHLKSDGYTNYSLETLHTGKARCKAALQEELGLPIREDVPLIGFIGRLDHQKGVDLIAAAMPWMVDQDLQLVMLGTGRSDLEDMLKHFESQYRDKVRGWVGFSVKVAHRITAGADILLMPSRFEPCGLNQLYAMNYGTIPVVHAVGGLRDTVQPFDPFNESGLGWTFDRAETDRLIHAMGNCLLTYREYKESWKGIQKRGMMQDLSWDNAAQNYEEVLVAAKYHW